MKAQISVSTPIKRSARVLQAGSMFDVPVEEKSVLTWDHELPVEDKPWNIGLIIGPSGSGKTTLARYFWPEQVFTDFPWVDDQSLLDDFPRDLGIKDLTGLLNSVGLASPPAWLRPFRTLSNGEAFRATVARALAESEGDVVVMDEFTSVVDRQVAQIASHTVQKVIRRTDRRFVAVTCHYDIVDWLQPDWIYDVAAGQFSWRSVQRHPPVELRIHKVDTSVWRMFARHHYLSAEINKSARCFGAFIGDDLVGFTSYLHFPHAFTKNVKIGHRLVVLPDYQGLGIGGRLDDWLGQYLWERGFKYHNSVAHPAMIRYYAASPRWRFVGDRKRSKGHHITPTGKTAPLRIGPKSNARGKAMLDPRRLNVYSFAYVPTAPQETP